MKTDLFEKFEAAILAARPPIVRDERLLIESAGGISVYYAPFEYINESARIVLVGITPGPTQMENANKAARVARTNGQSIADTLRLAKQTAGFSGEPMRSNLIGQLNHWGVHDWLGLQDSAELFSTAQHLVQSTSLLRYPVFKDGKDYAGSPSMTKNLLLRKQLLEHFVEEVRNLKDALFFSLGPKVQGVLDELATTGILPRDRIVDGLLHPSPNNTYRINYLLGNRRGPLVHATNPAPYDEGRTRFRLGHLGC
ncbi:MAG: hypothetical protein WBB85_00455 [Albidovulum sp.]|uniref:hypothetical protein n=1 Tax=Albidovulum sp. TaxID=1872424 RepID=UPI003CC07933